MIYIGFFNADTSSDNRKEVTFHIVVDATDVFEADRLFRQKLRQIWDDEGFVREYPRVFPRSIVGIQGGDQASVLLNVSIRADDSASDVVIIAPDQESAFSVSEYVDSLSPLQGEEVSM